jgi:5-methylcytosine-specific restriction protein A
MGSPQCWAFVLKLRKPLGSVSQRARLRDGPGLRIDPLLRSVPLSIQTRGEGVGRLTALPSRLAAQPQRLRQPPKTADPFYVSSEWKALKARRRLDPDYYAAKRRAKPGEWVILDHVRERRDGGADLDPANTEWLTMSEHAVKTAAARAKRARGSR